MRDNNFNEVTVLNIIIYARLSKEEKDKSREEQSKSIKNQVDICEKYIEEERLRFPSCQFKIISILKDDGVSGTTFERDDFKELINLVEEKKANMVITTDLSRLGRNHIKTDDYIEEWFPKHNVRYVSIIEGVDTYTDSLSNDIAPIINWSNEHFAKLTSKKIKGRFDLLRKEGKWTGGEVPLGYKMDSKIKYHFVIDERNATIVREIFKLFIQKPSCNFVADTLTKRCIPIPSILKKSKRCLDENLRDIWRPETIREILTNEMYLGYMVQGKTTRLNHKSKKIIYLPKENWTIIKGTHEPIISQKDFILVQALLKANKNKSEHAHIYLLKGLLCCHECGKSIGVQHYKDRNKEYTVCNYYRKYGQKKKLCSAHRFDYKKIERTVLKSVKECLKGVNFQQIILNVKAKIDNYKNEDLLDSKITECKKRISILKKEMDIVYDDKVSGLINEEQYKRSIQSRMVQLNCDNVLLESLVSRDKPAIQNLDYEAIARKVVYDNPRTFLLQIIEKIEIDEIGKVDIYYKIQKPWN